MFHLYVELNSVCISACIDVMEAHSYKCRWLKFNGRGSVQVNDQLVYYS